MDIEDWERGKRNRLTRGCITLASLAMRRVEEGGACTRVITGICRQARGWELFEGLKLEGESSMEDNRLSLCVCIKAAPAAPTVRNLM